MVSNLNQDLENVKSILQTYLLRGVKAGDALKSGQVDEAINLLTMQKAAYYNYLALDYRLRDRFPGYETTKQFDELWHSIKVANGELEETIHRKSHLLGKQLLALRNSRIKLNKFKSVTDGSRSFQSEA